MKDCSLSMIKQLEVAPDTDKGYINDGTKSF